MTDRILQQVSSDATIPSLDRSVSFEIIPVVTQNGNHIADQDADDDEDQGHAIGDVQESIVAVRMFGRINCIEKGFRVNR